MARAPRPVSGRVLAITGGARGIGRAIARAAARRGARVAIGDVDAAGAEAAAAELGSGAFGAGLDVTDHAAFTAFLDETEARLGPLDVLVNNAGIMPVTPLAEEDPGSIARQLAINLHAVIHGSQDAIRRMVPRGTGHVVNMASLAGRTGFPMLATYCATKHGVIGYSEAARYELRGSGVEVSVVMPGIVRTELSAGLGEARGVRTVTPEEVAAEVLVALEVPRFDVYVPRSAGVIVGVASALPRRLREAVARASGSDQALLGTDRAARVQYEARAAASARARD